MLELNIKKKIANNLKSLSPTRKQTSPIRSPSKEVTKDS